MRPTLFVVMAGVALPATAQDYTISDFDDASGLWRTDFGSAGTQISHDPFMDRDGDAGSGSMKVDMFFNIVAGATSTAITIDLFPAVDANAYTHFEASIFVDATSVQDSFGNYGFQKFAIRNTENYDFSGEGGSNLGPSGEWVDISIPIGNFGGAVDAMRAVTWELFGGPSQNLDGRVSIWMDNVRLVPAPSALALIGLGGIAATRRRR